MSNYSTLWKYLLDIEIRRRIGIAKDAKQNIRKLLTDRIMFRNKENTIHLLFRKPKFYIKYMCLVIMLNHEI